MSVPHTSQAGASLFSDPRAAQTHVETPANPPFLLRFHPDLWELVTLEPEGKGKARQVLIPQLGKDLLQPGVNGVYSESDERQGADCYRELVSKQIGRGWKYLDRSVQVAAGYLPPGVPAGSIYREAPVSARKGGGVYHYTAWETITTDPLMGGTRRSDHKQGLYRWLSDLAKTGAFGVPSESALENIRRQVVHRREEIRASRTMPVEVRTERLAAIDEQVKALNVAAAELAKAVGDA